MDGVLGVRVRVRVRARCDGWEGYSGLGLALGAMDERDTIS